MDVLEVQQDSSSEGRGVEYLELLVSKGYKRFLSEYPLARIFDQTSNPIISKDLMVVRNKDSSVDQLRRSCRRIGFLIANEIAKDLPLQRVEVTTPMNEQSAGYIIPENMNPILIDILGAAEPFTRGLEDAFENSPHALISARRRGHKIEDLIVETRYERLPRLDGKPLIFVDPALATALTLSGAYKKLVDGENKYGRIEGPIYIASIVATPFAMKRLRETIGDRLRGLYAVSCDLLLTEKGYIHGPGLNGIGGGGIGDAGDRFLGVIPVD